MNYKLFYVSGTSNTNTVSSSTFTNCGVSIFVDGDPNASPPLLTDFRMHCNQFSPPETGIINNQYGLISGFGIRLLKVGVYEGTSLIPGTNWFPTDPTVDRTTLPFSGDVQDWAAPSGWVSFYGENDFKYFRYLNEFASPYTGNSDLENSNLSVVNYGTTPPPGAVAATCPVSDNWPVIFPTRPALVSEVAPNKESIINSLYPNPCKDHFYFETANSLHIQEVVLSDLQGRAILRSKISNDKPISIGHLSNGMYRVSLLESSGKVSVHKLVIQH